MIYNYISAAPGAGKTEYAIQSALKTLAFNPVMFVVPTRRLCDEIESRSGGQIRAIHTGRYPGEKIAGLVEAVMSRVARTHHNEAIVITDAALSQIHFRHNNWELFKDEPKEPLQITVVNCEDSWEFVQNHLLDFDPHPTNDAFYTLRLKYPREYQLTTEWDDIFGAAYDLSQYLVASNHYEVLVDRESWDTLHTLRYSVFQRPECYCEWGAVTFMGANFEHSLLYNQWRHQGVEWRDVTPASLRAMPTERLRIHYLFSDIAWSATSRSRKFNGRTNLEWFLEWIRTELPQGNYVYCANNSYDDEQLNLAGDRMPAECHGLNAWRDHRHCVLLGSYHQFQGDELFYQYYKTSTTDIRGMRNTQYYVQQLTRTNIRCYDDTGEIHAYIPTLREALDLIQYFPDAEIVDPDEQHRHWRLRRNWQPRPLLSDVQPSVCGLTMGTHTFSNAVLLDSNGDVIDTPDDSTTASSGTANGFLQKKRDLYIYKPTKICRNQTDTGRKGPRGQGRPTTAWPGDPYLGLIVKFAQESSLEHAGVSVPVFKKNHLPWFSPGIFLTGSRMTKDNCVGVSIIGFDFDDARFSNRELAEILRGTEHLIYTTISHDPRKPYRKIRVVVPLSRPISISEHERLMAYYAWQFDLLGKGSLDESTLGAERKFYMPHREADIEWVKTRKQPLNVDKLLLKIPKVPLIQAPQRSDLVQVVNGVTVQDSNYVPLFDKIQAVIDSMTPGDRSYKATKVGGMMRNLPQERHEEVFALMRSRGVDESALKSARKYAQH